MVGFGEIVNNKQFGNTYQTNPLFRKAYQSLIKKTGPGLKDLMMALKMDIDKSGSVKFIYEAMGSAPMSFEQARAAWQFNNTIKSTREYSSGAGTYRTGPYSNEVANEILGGQGYRSRVVSHSLGDKDDLSDFLSKYRTKSGDFYGLPNPNQESINVLEVFDRQGKSLTTSEIQKVLGLKMKDYSPKRLNILFSDRALAVSRASDDPFKVHLFDPEALFKSLYPNLDAQVGQMARVQRASGKYVTKDGALKTTKDLRKEIYETMSDGLNYMTQEAFEDRMLDLESKATKVLASGDRARYEAIIKTVREQREQVAKGGSFNIRVSNGLDQLGNHLGQIKGDVQVITSNLARKMFGIDNTTGIDVFTSLADVKDEFEFGNVNLMTMEPQGLPTTARSNVLTTATFQDMIDQGGYLDKSTQNQISKHIEDIKAGKISNDLRKMFDEIDKLDPNDMGSSAAGIELKKSQEFIRRLKGMVESGVPINTNDFVSGQLFKAMSQHYTRSRKGKAGKTLSFMGQESPYYEMSFPMEGSTSAHITNLVDGTMSGTLGIDHKAGRFRLSGVDIVRMKEAFGGSDLDDRLYSVLKYDESTSRLFAFTFRDPNEAGEYMIFDANITFDKNIPRPVRKLHADAQKLKSKIPHMEKGPVREAAVAELNEMHATLNNFFSGRSVDIGRNVGLNAGNSIQQIDLAQMLAEPVDRPSSIFAPKGWVKDASAMRKYKSGSFMRSFSQWKDSDTAVKVAKRELAEEVSGSAGRTPFKYVGGGYSEYHSRYFQPLPKVVSKPVDSTLSEKIARRLQEELGSKGILGRAVNAQSVFDEFLLSNLKGLPPDLAIELEKQWKLGAFTHIDREAIIDAYVKSGDQKIITDAAEAITNNYEELGKLIKKMQGIAGDRANIGLDSIMFQTRLERDTGALAAFQKGFGRDDGYLLPDGDAKAFVSRLYAQQSETARFLAEEGESVRTAARQNLLDVIDGTEFTSKQLADASDFISSMQQSSDELSRLFNSSQEELAELIGRQLNGEGVLDGDDLNTAGIRKLYDQGFLRGITDEDGIKNLVPTAELDKHMVAIAKILAENNKSLATVMTMGEQGDESLFNLYTGAMQREVYGPKALKKIDEITRLEEIADFVAGEGIDRRFTELASQVYDPVERNIKLIDKMISIHGQRPYDAATRRESYGLANFLISDIRRSGQVDDDELLGFARNVRQSLKPSRGADAEVLPVPGLKYTPRQPINGAPPGLRRLSARSAADAASNTVSRSVRERMTRLDREFLGQALQDPIIRKGAIGLGIFAGIGILHRLTKDPTPEDAGGPPLLPGGNPYESYDAATTQDMSYIYPSLNSFGSGGGMMYTVRTNGNYDPEKLGNRIGSITGANVRSNIYNTRQVYRPNQSSQDILNGMIG